MGRLIGERAMTPAERQKRRRERLADEAQSPHDSPAVQEMIKAYRRLTREEKDAFLLQLKTVPAWLYAKERKDMIRRFAAAEWKVAAIPVLFDGRDVKWPEIKVLVGGCGNNNYRVFPQDMPRVVDASDISQGIQQFGR